jgi:hypothetical protein
MSIPDGHFAGGRNLSKGHGTPGESLEELLRRLHDMLTPEGGRAVWLTNDTGNASVKGTIVRTSTSIDRGFVVSAADENQAIGVVYDDGIADGGLCRVVMGGLAEVLLKDGTASTHGNWVYCSDVGGRADATLPAPPVGGVVELDIHMREIGHCFESKVSGTDVLVLCAIHPN